MGTTATSDSGIRRRRLPALQLLIIFSVVGVVAGIGLPAFAARAKGAVLTQNVRTLQQQVREQLVASGGTDVQARELCAAIAAAARLDAARPYVNPVSGSRDVVCAEQGRAPEEAPALLIVRAEEPDEGEARWLGGSLQDRAGTLIVVVRSRAGVANAVEVRYVNEDGEPHCVDVLAVQAE